MALAWLTRPPPTTSSQIKPPHSLLLQIPGNLKSYWATWKFWISSGVPSYCSLWLELPQLLPVGMNYWCQHTHRTTQKIRHIVKTPEYPTIIPPTNSLIFIYISLLLHLHSTDKPLWEGGKPLVSLQNRPALLGGMGASPPESPVHLALGTAISAATSEQAIFLKPLTKKATKLAHKSVCVTQHRPPASVRPHCHALSATALTLT